MSAIENAKTQAMWQIEYLTDYKARAELYDLAQFIAEKLTGDQCAQLINFLSKNNLG
jgi:hypothetical protein